MNKAVGPSDFYELQRRSQNFTLGLLAIEQLTGAVKAQQAALGTTSSAATGDNVDKETAALDLATKARDDAQTDQAKAQSALKDATASRDASKVKSDAAKASQTALPATATDAAKASAKASVDAAATDVTTKQKDVDAKKIDSESADRTLKSAEAKVASAQGTLDDAKRQVRASAAGSAQLSAMGGSAAAVTDRVATAVQAIVRNVLDSSGRGESCVYLMASVAQSPALASDVGFAATVRLACTEQQAEVIASTVQRLTTPAAAATFRKNLAPQ